MGNIFFQWILIHTVSDLFGILKEPMPTVDLFGRKLWHDNEGRLHRDNDRPAMECLNGRKEWYVHGKRHRQDGLPAIVDVDDFKVWYVNGKYIRHL